MPSPDVFLITRPMSFYIKDIEGIRSRSFTEDVFPKCMYNICGGRCMYHVLFVLASCLRVKIIDMDVVPQELLVARVRGIDSTLATPLTPSGVVSM